MDYLFLLVTVNAIYDFNLPIDQGIFVGFVKIN